MMSVQLVSIFAMFISGIVVGAAIDAVRTTIGQAPFKSFHKIGLIVEWFIWIILAISTFYLLFIIKGGQWRLVDPLAQLAGIISYELFFQNITRFIGRLMVNIIIKPIYYIGHILALLIMKFIKFFIKLCTVFINPIFKVFEKYLLKGFKTK